MTQIITSLFSPLQGEVIPDPATLWPTRQIVLWTAAHVFHIAGEVPVDGNSGSGDGAFGWVLAFCLLVFAAVATAVGSLLDRERKSYVQLYNWFLLFLRFALAGQMLNYGLAKVIPVQMPYPSLTRLLQPYGSFSPMGVLWSSIGASTAYEIFAGCTEVLGGLLLIFRRTSTFGALICLAAMVQVFVLNMTYDVPVKLFAFHLILLSAFLLTSNFLRLVNVLLLNRATAPAAQTQLFRTRGANRAMLAGQILVGLWLVAMNAYEFQRAWYEYGGGRATSPLYGMWQVSELSIDGQVRPLLVTDAEQWRRVIFDWPTVIAFQRMDDSFVRYRTAINADAKTIVLTKADEKWSAHFTFQRVAPAQLILDGEMDKRMVHAQLTLMKREHFVLVNRGFHWIQEYAFNR